MTLRKKKKQQSHKRRRNNSRWSKFTTRNAPKYLIPKSQLRIFVCRCAICVYKVFLFNFFLFALNQAVGVGVHFKGICFLPDECLPRQEDIKHSLDGNFHLSLRSWRLALPPVTGKIDWRKDLKRNE